jgi:hypothetical protein
MNNPFFGDTRASKDSIVVMVALAEDGKPELSSYNYERHDIE